MSGDLKAIYNNMWIRNIAIALLLLSLVSCREKHSDISANSKLSKNDMADLNRYLIQKDRERIKNYIERKNLIMTESPTGLWYQIIKQGSGNSFSENDKVIMEYECSLLDGTKCYSSKDLGPKDVTLGRSEMEPGLNEGLRLLKPGAEAIFIIPPFLAYGLVGDRKMIPPRAVIVYNVYILQARY
jgi:FKBP-type peptidyl-prolyl cis-trans isomerase FkpA